VINTEVLLAQTKDIVLSATRSLINLHQVGDKSYEYQANLPREMKAKVDHVMEKEILEQLVPLGLSIVSEETGYLKGKEVSDQRFIVDPLDGTVNFIRNIAPSSVSIALFQGYKPIFGVLGLFPSGDIAWGGKDIGAFINDNPIKVSSINDKTKSILCTGIPSRLNLNNPSMSASFLELIESYGKVRMLGAASMSLLQVAKGSAETYKEQDIMLWDVAAGLALVEGAGGYYDISEGSTEESINVIATNGEIDE